MKKQMRSWRLIGMAIMSVLALVLVACGDDDTAESQSDGAPTSDEEAQAEDEPQSGGSITMMIPNQVSPTFDPATLQPGGIAGGLEGQLLYGNLVVIDRETREVVPRMLESLTPNEDATVWTLSVREGITFSDGTSLDAAAIAANWDRFADPASESRAASVLEGLDYSVEDPLTLEVTSSSPFAALPSFLFNQGLGSVASPTALDEFGDEYGTSPDTTVGAGPFVLDQSGQTENVWVRNPDYWDDPRPYLDEITTRVVPDLSQMADAFIAGQGDTAEFVQIGDATERVRDAGFELLDDPRDGALGMRFNVSRAPFDDVRVREAVTLALEFDELNEKATGGIATQADTWFAPDSPYHDPSITAPEPNLERAQTLIDEYVEDTGEQVTFELLMSDVISAWGVPIQQQVNRLDGVEMELNVPTGGTSQFVNTGDFDAVFFVSANWADYPSVLRPTWHGDSPANVTGYSNPAVNQLFEESSGATEIEERAEYLNEITSELLDDFVLNMIARPQFAAVAAEDLRGVTLTVPGQINPIPLWLDQ